MIYLIILLFVLVIYLYCRITYVRNKLIEWMGKKIEESSKTIENICIMSNAKIKSIIQQSQINSIISKEDRLITLLKAAKERGYFEKKFIPVNEHLVFKHNPSDIICNYRYNIVNDSLWIPSRCVGTIGMGIEMIYQNGRWAEIVEPDQTLVSDTFSPIFNRFKNKVKVPQAPSEEKQYVPMSEKLKLSIDDFVKNQNKKVDKNLADVNYTDEMIGVLKNLYPDKKVQKNLSDLEISIMDLKNKKVKNKQPKKDVINDPKSGYDDPYDILRKSHDGMRDNY